MHTNVYEVVFIIIHNNVTRIFALNAGMSQQHIPLLQFMYALILLAVNKQSTHRTAQVASSVP